MPNPETTFEKFAEEYDRAMGESGDYSHRNTIDPALLRAIGDYRGKVIYDIGCGNGHMARVFANGGASRVYASDISSRLVDKAIKHGEFGGRIKYNVCDASDVSQIPSNSMDFVTMNMVIQYVKNFPDFLDRLQQILKRDGHFIFTAVHPLKKIAILDAQGRTDIPEDALKTLRNYSKRSHRTANNLWLSSEKLNIYEAPIEFYISHLVAKGFVIDKFIEQPTDIIIDNNPASVPVASPIPFVYALGARKS